MTAVDVPILLLGVSAIVLVASIVAMSAVLPTPTWFRRRWWRRRRAAGRPIQATHRPFAAARTAGRPSPLSPLALPPASFLEEPRRQDASGRDGLRRRAELAAAEATIEHLLHTDPDRIARLMMEWIHDDDRGEPA